MKMSPTMQAEHEALAQHLFAKGGRLAPATIEAARTRARLAIENKYSPIMLEHVFERVMGGALHQRNRPVPTKAQSAAIARGLAGWCDGSITALSAVAAVAVHGYCLKEVAFQLVSAHKAPAGRLHEDALSVGDVDFAARLAPYVTADDDMDAAWAELQRTKQEER